MNSNFKKILNKIKSWHLILLFFLINIIFLENFPFVHSDEAWLSGLSRQIMKTGNLSSTERFFDLLPRHPHAVKIFFHFLQILFIKILDYNIFTFRLISLLSSSLAAFFFYKTTLLISKSKKLSLAALLVLIVDIHFIYSSHFARQEAVLLFIFLAALYYFLKYNTGKKLEKKGSFLKINNNSRKQKNTTNNPADDFILALILGTAIGFHPNAFIIALPFILSYSYRLLIKKISIKNYLIFGISLSLIAGLFIYFSFKLDPNFISNYSSYGKQLGVLDSFAVKFENLKNFYLKLYYRVSGTYYIPPINFQLIFFTFTALISFFKLFLKEDDFNLYLLLSLISVNLGYLIIGRYNQTSIIFIFPIGYLLFINLIKNLNLNLKIIIITALTLILTFNSVSAVIKDSHYNYQDYLTEISQVVEKDTHVLANLNADYYFDNGSLFDYRNLAFLKENNLSFADYIKKNKIKYIIYPEEMDVIYNSRPRWNILYGNLYPYYSEMKQFIKEKTTLVKEFNNSTYAMRIVSKIDQKNWKVKIYKVNSNF